MYDFNYFNLKILIIYLYALYMRLKNANFSRVMNTSDQQISKDAEINANCKNICIICTFE